MATLQPGSTLVLRTTPAIRWQLGVADVVAEERTPARIVSDISKYTGQSVRPADISLNDLESNRLAGIFRVIWSNLCTRHIPDKLKPRGHHDWPDNTD